MAKGRQDNLAPAAQKAEYGPTANCVDCTKEQAILRSPAEVAPTVGNCAYNFAQRDGFDDERRHLQSTMRRPLPPLNERPRNGARRHKLRELLSLGRSMGPKLNGGALILRPGESQDPGRRVGIAGFWDPALAETAVVIKTRNISAPSEVWPPARKPAFLHLRSLCRSQGRPRSSAWRCCAPCSVCRCRRACSRPGQDAFPP